MERIIVQINPDKIDVPKKCESEKDRYDTIVCILCHGVNFIRIEAEGMKMIWIFDKREIIEIEEKILTGKPFDIPWLNVMPALNKWKDAFLALKEILRNQSIRR
jgi:hypothetical protein